MSALLEFDRVLNNDLLASFFKDFITSYCTPAGDKNNYNLYLEVDFSINKLLRTPNRLLLLKTQLQAMQLLRQLLPR